MIQELRNKVSLYTKRETKVNCKRLLLTLTLYDFIRISLSFQECTTFPGKVSLLSYPFSSLGGLRDRTALGRFYI